jgi:hypothetical protein
MFWITTGRLGSCDGVIFYCSSRKPFFSGQALGGKTISSTRLEVKCPSGECVSQVLYAYSLSTRLLVDHQHNQHILRSLQVYHRQVNWHTYEVHDAGNTPWLQLLEERRGLLLSDSKHEAFRKPAHFVGFHPPLRVNPEGKKERERK